MCVCVCARACVSVSVCVCVCVCAGAVEGFAAGVVIGAPAAAPRHGEH